MINSILEDEIRAHAIEYGTRECCGLVVKLPNGSLIYYKANNLSVLPDNFIIDPKSIIEAENLGTIECIVHSHVNYTEALSPTDSASHAKSGYYWIIYSLKTEVFGHYPPVQTYKIPPLIGRKFIFGVQDCYTLIQDYYKITLDIALKDYPREDKFWDRLENLYVDRFIDAGFTQVPMESLKTHDVVLLKLGVTSISNHGAVYLGNGNILHHVQNRLSEESQYIRHWKSMTTHVLRYNTLI